MIKEAKINDINHLVNLARALWLDSSIDELSKLFSEVIDCKDRIIYLALEECQITGFAYFSLRRDYVEGTSTSPIGYLEGIYIKPNYRNKGFGKQLIEKGLIWAKLKRCKEFASDCEIDNELSILFHKKIGFREANKIVCFVKDIK